MSVNRSELGGFIGSELQVRGPASSGPGPVVPEELSAESYRITQAGVYIDEWEDVDPTGLEYRESFYIPMVNTFEVGLRAWGQSLAAPGFGARSEHLAILSEDPVVTSLGPLPGDETPSGFWAACKRPTKATVDAADASLVNLFKAQMLSLIPNPVGGEYPTQKDKYLNQALISGISSNRVLSGTALQSAYIGVKVTLFNQPTVLTFLASSEFFRTIPYDGVWTGRYVLYTKAL